MSPQMEQSGEHPGLCSSDTGWVPVTMGDDGRPAVVYMLYCPVSDIQQVSFQPRTLVPSHGKIGEEKAVGCEGMRVRWLLPQSPPSPDGMSLTFTTTLPSTREHGRALGMGRPRQRNTLGNVCPPLTVFKPSTIILEISLVTYINNRISFLLHFKGLCLPSANSTSRERRPRGLANLAKVAWSFLKH